MNLKMGVRTEVVQSHILILAAGSSSRLGQSKQTVLHRGTPLLVHTVTQALHTHIRVTVVLGAKAAAHQALLAGQAVDMIVDPDWHRGMGHTLKFGLRHLLQTQPSLPSLIVSVCDQPFITTSVFGQLLAQTAPLAACQYRTGWGVPARFTNPFFSHMLQLGDAEGAKKLLSQHEAEVAKVPFPYGDVDIDTPEDLKKLDTENQR